jgi:hypothetical protein
MSISQHHWLVYVRDPQIRAQRGCCYTLIAPACNKDFFLLLPRGLSCIIYAYNPRTLYRRPGYYNTPEVGFEAPGTALGCPAVGTAPGDIISVAEVDVRNEILELVVRDGSES